MVKIETLSDGSSLIKVIVSPSASKTKLLGLRGDSLKIAVNAPPERGKANKALAEFLSDLLALPKSAIRLKQGKTSREKTLIVQLESARLEQKVLQILKDSGFEVS
jgi:uncharacterized protein (TIGR00251 family)